MYRLQDFLDLQWELDETIMKDLDMPNYERLGNCTQGREMLILRDRRVVINE